MGMPFLASREPAANLPLNKLPITENNGAYCQQCYTFWRVFNKYRLNRDLEEIDTSNALDTIIQKVAKEFYGARVTAKRDISAQIGRDSYDEYSGMFTSQFTIAMLTDAEDERIQTLINELRNEINKSEKLTKDHKERILAKLEETQKELHRRINKLDKTLSAFVQISITMGQCGENMKPFTDRMREVFETISAASNRTGLLSFNPFGFLGKAKNDEAEETTNGK